MDEKETYVSGLIVSQTGDDYKLRYNLRQFPNPIKLEEFKYILEGNKKAKINNQVETFNSTIDSETDLEECRKEIQSLISMKIPLKKLNKKIIRFYDFLAFLNIFY